METVLNEINNSFLTERESQTTPPFSANGLMLYSMLRQKL
jgi:hypothetical protein